MTIKTIFHYYRFDVRDASQNEEYEQLVWNIENQLFLECVKSYEIVNVNVAKDLDNREIPLETEHVFNNQWNTPPINGSSTGYRLFDWAENIYPQRAIKEGYWLEQTEEMKQIRTVTLTCGYCGSQYHNHTTTEDFCLHCIGSPYLNEEELYLLRLVPVQNDTFGDVRRKLSEREREYLVPIYSEEQRKTKERMQEKQRMRIVEDCQRKVAEAERERDGYIWLLNNEISIDNCIYYSHKGEFCFGWRNPVSPGVAEQLEFRLQYFPYPYSIQKKTR